MTHSIQPAVALASVSVGGNVVSIASRPKAVGARSERRARMLDVLARIEKRFPKNLSQSLQGVSSATVSLAFSVLNKNMMDAILKSDFRAAETAFKLGKELAVEAQGRSLAYFKGYQARMYLQADSVLDYAVRVGLGKELISRMERAQASGVHRSERRSGRLQLVQAGSA